MTARGQPILPLAVVDAALHPAGRCECAGEGRCEWCKADLGRGIDDYYRLPVQGPTAHVGHPAWILSAFEGYPTWITIPGPPHAQQRPRLGRQGTYKPDKGAQDAISWAIRSQWRGAPIEGPVAVYLRFLMPNERRKDVDNLVKAGFDAMTKAGVWLDDTQCQVLIALKDIDRANPRTELAFGLRRGA